MQLADLRMSIAKAIHDSWATDTFDPSAHPEDVEAADKVIALLALYASIFVSKEAA